MFCEANKRSDFSFVFCASKLDQLTAQNVSWKLLSFVAIDKWQPFWVRCDIRKHTRTTYLHILDHNFMHSRRLKSIKFQWDENETNRKSADGILNTHQWTSDGSFCHLKSTNKIKIIFENRRTAFHPRWTSTANRQQQYNKSDNSACVLRGAHYLFCSLSMQGAICEMKTVY